MPFGKKAVDMRLLLRESESTHNYLQLLIDYKKEGGAALAKIREKQVEGIV